MAERINIEQLRKHAPTNPILAFMPVSTGSPMQDWCSHLSQNPQRRQGRADRRRTGAGSGGSSEDHVTRIRDESVLGPRRFERVCQMRKSNSQPRRSDAVIFRPNSPSSGLGTWYIRRSSDLAQQTQQYGLSTDTPAPADYDGDGKADFGVWRTSNSTFYSTNSGNAALNTIAFSLAGDKVVSADFDGDGKADYAVYNTSSAAWHIRSSQSGTIATTTWSSGGDIAVPNDYDGDGKVDIAAWRDSNGTWYIRQSSKIGITGQTPSTGNPYPNELRQTQWGQSGDIPVPSLWRR